MMAGRWLRRVVGGSVSRSVFARWRHLTPDVGRFLAHYAGPTHRHLVDVYVDYHRPTWHLAWGVETMWRNESPFAFPTMPAEVFAATAWILHEPAERLSRQNNVANGRERPHFHLPFTFTVLQLRLFHRRVSGTIM